MISGRIIAESLKPGADLRLDGLRLTRLGRHDVSTSTLPTDERTDAQQHGVTEGQPAVWTFIDFEAPDDLADHLTQSLAEAVAWGRAAGTPEAQLVWGP